VRVAVTAGNARLLGMVARMGTIVPGMIADVIAVEGEPAPDVAALRRIRLVMQERSLVRARDVRRHDAIVALPHRHKAVMSESSSRLRSRTSV
jgi:hypothetical protein